MAKEIKPMSDDKKGKSKKCICMQPEDGAPFYCYTMEGGRLIECPGKGPFETQEECEAASCEG